MWYQCCWRQIQIQGIRQEARNLEKGKESSLNIPQQNDLLLRVVLLLLVVHSNQRHMLFT